MLKETFLLLSIISLGFCFVFSVDPSGQECFYERCEASSSVKMMFQVLEGGSMDIDFTVSTFTPPTLSPAVHRLKRH